MMFLLDYILFARGLTKFFSNIKYKIIVFREGINITCKRVGQSILITMEGEGGDGSHTFFRVGQEKSFY